MKYKYLLCLLVAFVVFVLLYKPANLYFLSDDFDSMYSSLQWQNILHSYRPMSDLFLLIDHQLWGDNATNYHITNMLIHFASTTVLFGVANKLFAISCEPIIARKNAFFTAVLFLFYAYHSEPIFWLVGRASLLATLFTLCSLYFFLQIQKTQLYYALSLLSFCLALFAYESTWAYPIIVTWVAIIYFQKEKPVTKFFYALGYWIVFSGYLGIRFYLTQTVIGSPYGTKTIVKYDLFSLIKNFAALFSRSVIPPLQSTTIYLICFAILLLLLIFFLQKTKRHWNNVLFICMPAFIVALLPVITLGIDTHYTESERFLYLPSVFFCIVIVQLLLWLLPKRFVFVFCALLLVNMCQLFISYSTFKSASAITKTTVQVLTTLANIDTLYCLDLPTQYKGAFIFRNGIVNAAKYYQPSIKHVTIFSETEFPNALKNNYALSLLSAKDLSLKDSLFTLQNKCALIRWKAEKLEVFK